MRTHRLPGYEVDDAFDRRAFLLLRNQCKTHIVAQIISCRCLFHFKSRALSVVCTAHDPCYRVALSRIDGPQVSSRVVSCHVEIM